MLVVGSSGSRRRFRHVTSTASWVAIPNTDFPQLEPGQFLGWIRMRSITSSNTDGTVFYFKIGGAIPTNDDDGEPVSGSGQTISEPGITYGTPIYLRKVTAGDEVHFAGMLS